MDDYEDVPARPDWNEAEAPEEDEPVVELAGLDDPPEYAGVRSGTELPEDDGAESERGPDLPAFKDAPQKSAEQLDRESETADLPEPRRRPDEPLPVVGESSGGSMSGGDQVNDLLGEIRDLLKDLPDSIADAIESALRIG